MDIEQLLVKVVLAILCAGVANILIPRQVPGKLTGLVLIGLAGVVLGEWIANFIRQEYGITFDWLRWQISGVAIVPAIVGSVVVLYSITTLMSWTRYR
jgi:uncharacterized membrane protein YeaQ/YmgE (transglycosylase-associated protein family)